MPRISKITPESIAATVAELERDGERVTVRGVMERSGGSTDSVTQGLRLHRDLHKAARADLQGSGVFEAMDALCIAVRKHQEKIFADAEKKIEQGLCQIAPLKDEVDQALAAKHVAQEGEAIMRAELQHLHTVGQQQGARILELQAAHQGAMKQAGDAEKQLAVEQVRHQHTREQLRDRQNEIKALNGRTMDAVFQQRVASEAALRLQRDLASVRQELDAVRARLVVFDGVKDLGANETVGAVIVRDARLPAAAERDELRLLREENRDLLEKNAGLTATLKMAEDLMKDMAPGPDSVDVDLSELT